MSLPVSVSNDLPVPLGPRMIEDLSRSQKAAIVVHLLLREGADPGVSRLPARLQRRLAKVLSSVGEIDNGTLAAVVREFASHLDGDGLRFPKDLRGALRALNGSLSPNVVSDLASELTGGADEIANSSWDAFGAMEVEHLVKTLEHESPEVIAIAVSKLKPVRAAAVMKEFDDELAVDVAIAMSATQSVATETVSRIGLSFGRAMEVSDPKAFVGDPAERVGAILNAALSSDRARVLDGLVARVPEFAARVRGAVFSWENIPERLDARDIPRVLKEVENEQVLVAFDGDLEEKVAVFLLSGLSKRLGEQMREEIAEMPKPKPPEVEEARLAIATVIRDMEERGDLVLSVPDDDDEA